MVTLQCVDAKPKGAVYCKAKPKGFVKGELDPMDDGLLGKLRYKGGRAEVLNAPEVFQLSDAPASANEDKSDFVLLFVNNAEEVDKWVPEVIPGLKEDAVFWIAYPKQSSKVKTDINRDILAAMVQDNTPYRPVSAAALDTTWSALRFREKTKVKTKK